MSHAYNFFFITDLRLPPRVFYINETDLPLLQPCNSVMIHDICFSIACLYFSSGYPTWKTSTSQNLNWNISYETLKMASIELKTHQHLCQQLTVEAAKNKSKYSSVFNFFNSNSDSDQLKKLSLTHILINIRKKKFISYGASTYFFN